MQDLGLEERTDRPESWGRREPHCARGAGRRARRTGAGEPRGRRPGGLGVALKFCAGRSGSEKANVGRVLRGVQGRPGESNSREKQMEGETCAPAGGRGAGRRVRAGTRGGAGKPRRPRGCGDGVTGGRRPSPTRPSQGGPGSGTRGRGPGVSGAGVFAPSRELAHLLSRLGCARRRSGDQGHLRRGVAAAAPEKIKKVRRPSGCPPLPPPPAPSPEAALPPPLAAAVANLPLYPVPMVPPPRPASTRTQPRSPLYCPEAAAAARPAASPPAQPAPGSRERQHAAVPGPAPRQPHWLEGEGWPSLLARPSY